MSDLKDPSTNYTVPFQPSGMRIPEFVMRQLIGFAIGKIRESIGTPNDVVEMLFRQTPDEVREDIKTWLLKHTNIYLDVSWPREDVHLPLIVVEPQSEEEDTANALLGDYAQITAIDDGFRKAGQPQYAIPERHSTSIYIATDDDRYTLFLYQMVKFILLSNKDGLTKWYDIHAVSLSGQALSYDEKLLPIMGYYRVLTVSYFCMFDFAGAEEAAKVVSLGLMASTVAPDGVEVVVEVPFPEP